MLWLLSAVYRVL